MNLEEVRKLYLYNIWANRRVVESLQSLDQETFTQDLNTSYRSVRGTLAHLAAAEWIWLNRWKGHSPSNPLPETEFETVEASSRRLREIDQELLSYVDTLSQTDLEDAKDYATLDGKHYSSILTETLQHLINHSTYHRGQIASLLRQIGAVPQGTDFITYCRMTRS